MAQQLNEEAALEHPQKPLWRGRLHQLMVFVAIPAGVLLIVQARTGSARVAVSVYALSLVALFGTSAAYHRGNWSPKALRRMRSLDHSMIFFLIAGTGTAFGVLVLTGWMRVVFLVTLWIGATMGIVFKLVKIEGFARLGGILYMGLGWIGVATVPQAIQGSEVLPLVLIAIGGLMYTVGAVIFYRRRPDPKPLVFGYHEIWHSFVVAASACQYTAITMLVRTAS
jgi:hemolysin III